MVFIGVTVKRDMRQVAVVILLSSSNREPIRWLPVAAESAAAVVNNEVQRWSEHVEPMGPREPEPMKILRSDLPHCPELHGAVVVIDVLRSFTTAAYALARGATEVVVVDSIEAARAQRERDGSALAIGAVGGGAPAPGLDMGNSPSQVGALDLSGRRVILYTAGGTRGLVACDHADVLLAASLVCAGATTALLRALAPPSVTLVVTGTWSDRDGDEDHACADLIEALLRGDDPPRASYAARVRDSDFGRRFIAGSDPNLPVADLDCCAAVDRFDFALPIRRVPSGLVIRRADGDVTLDCFRHDTPFAPR
jgi:2-phosphosulfolactate phosphatase